MTANDLIRFWKRVIKREDTACWSWLGGKTREGYGKFWLNGKTERAHRIMWILTHGDIPINKFVCHTCDNPNCVNPKHLWLGTPLDNVLDMVQKDRQAKGDRTGAHVHPESVRRGDASWSRQNPEKLARGSQHGMHKLTEREIPEIRVAHAEGVAQQELAKKYNVSISMINRIVLRKNWKHIT